MATKKTFAFRLGDRVKLAGSNETGDIIGQARYTYSNPSYLVRYVAADGRLVEAWWNEDAIEVAVS